MFGSYYLSLHNPDFAVPLRDQSPRLPDRKKYDVKEWPSLRYLDGVFSPTP